MIGGGRFHGPRPRDYSFKLNKKLKELARFSALTYKAKEQKVLVVEALSFDKPSTKSFVNLLGKLDLTGKRTLFLLDNNDSNIVLSGRNIPKNKMIPATNVNTYEVMLANHLIITENALTKLTETFNKN